MVFSILLSRQPSLALLFFKLIEVETKFPFANSISAFSRGQDPKRTWRLFKCLNWRDTISSILHLGASNEATRLHRVSRWLDSHMAVCCMGAAGSTRAAHRRAHDCEGGRSGKPGAYGGLSAKPSA